MVPHVPIRTSCFVLHFALEELTPFLEVPISHLPLQCSFLPQGTLVFEVLIPSLKIPFFVLEVLITPSRSLLRL